MSDFNLFDLRDELISHPAVQNAGIRDLHIGAMGDKITLRVIQEDEQIAQVTHIVPGWRDRISADRNGFVDWLASVVPRRYRNQLQPARAKLNLRYLFLRIMQDLRVLVISTDDYDMLRTAPILRLLLLDRRPLAQQVNRDFRLKIRFNVGVHLPPNEPDPQTGPVVRVKRGLRINAVGDSFAPDSPERVRANLDWDQFLNVRVLHLRNDDFTVRELIKHMAHVVGLVHAGEPREEKERTLLFWRTIVDAGGISPGLITLRAIGRVALKALTPLTERCAQALSTSNL